jgi:hypothetical protein
MARKIEQSVTDAIRARRAFCGGNTQVTPTADGLLVTLHGHKVAHLFGSTLVVDWCGWNTTTTRSRINCALDALAPGYYACLRNRRGVIMSRATHTPVEPVIGVAS